MSKTSLNKKIFDDLLSSYNTAKYIDSDPIKIAHRFQKKEDIEIASFIAALFAYGQVRTILKSVENILKPMGESPYLFIRRYEKPLPLWTGFYHRFHNESHIIVLIRSLNVILEKHKTLGGFFRSEFIKTGSLEACLNAIAEEFWKHFKIQMQMCGFKPEKIWQGMRFLVNSPNDGSACKRMLMFLRWMVRRDGIDFGLWSDWCPASALIIPVDTHIARISYFLRLRKGILKKAGNWKMALEITENLAKMNPQDPVAYDFAMTRLGILDLCKKKYVSTVCRQCPVMSVCRYTKPHL